MKHTTKSNIHNSFATKDIIGTISAFFYEIISIRTSIDICIVIFLFFLPSLGIYNLYTLAPDILRMLAPLILFIALTELYSCVVRLIVRILSTINEILVKVSIIRVIKRKSVNISSNFVIASRPILVYERLYKNLYKITKRYFEWNVRINLFEKFSSGYNTIPRSLFFIATISFIANRDFLSLSESWGINLLTLDKYDNIPVYARDIISVLSLSIIILSMSLRIDKFYVNRDIKRDAMKNIYTTILKSPNPFIRKDKSDQSTIKKYILSALHYKNLIYIGDTKFKNDITEAKRELKNTYEDFRYALIEWVKSIRKDIHENKYIRYIFNRELLESGLDINIIKWIDEYDDRHSNLGGFVYGEIEMGSMDLSCSDIEKVYREKNQYDAEYTIYGRIVNIICLYMNINHILSKINPSNNLPFFKFLYKLINVK